MVAVKELTSFEKDKEVVTLKPTIEYWSRHLHIHNENAAWLGLSATIACGVAIWVSKTGTPRARLLRWLVLAGFAAGGFFFSVRP